MRIYIVYRHYWPDTTSYARILRSIAERLADDGHEVTVFAAQPNYNDIKHEKRPLVEHVGGVRIIRMPLLWERKSVIASRILNSGLFMTGSLLYGLAKERPDLIMTVSTPPVFMGATARVLAGLKGTKYLYHCQDLYPEIGLLGGKFGRGVIHSVMQKAEFGTRRNADALVVLSDDMADAVTGAGSTGNNVEVLTNFLLEQYTPPPDLPGPLQRAPGTFRVLFAGNMGVFQGLDTVIQAAHMLADEPDIQFLFLGQGLAKEGLMRDAGELKGKTVFFHDYVPVETAVKVMEESDLGLVPLQPEVYKYAFPSKTMMLLAAGLPVLVVVEDASQLGQLVRERRIGWTAPPGDAERMAAAIREAFEQRSDAAALRARALEASDLEFGRERLLDRWSALIQDLGSR